MPDHNLEQGVKDKPGRRADTARMWESRDELIQVARRIVGQSGNPKGRPKGARNRLGTQFLEALEADFNKFGPQAIAPHT